MLRRELETGFSSSHVKLRDVARHARVSAATVSRVVNDDPRVGAELRRRVIAAIEELGYRPNRLARNLRAQRTATMGLVVPDIENPHFTEMVRAVEDQAFQRGYHVLVCNTDESAAKQASYLTTLMDERVLGVILSPSDPEGREIGMLIDQGIPVVAYDREVADPRADAVVADNVKAARAATNILIDAGHRDIAYVGGRPEVETGTERQDGYELAMRTARLEPRVVNGDFRIDHAYDVTVQLLRDRRPPTGIIVANNQMTLGTLQALHEAGASIGAGGIGLVAIDDPFWARFVAPPLTTVGQPIREMAIDAMERLLERVSGSRTIRRRSLHAFEIHRRASCGTTDKEDDR